MPIVCKEKEPLRFEFDVYNERNEKTHVSTDLYTIRYILWKMSRGYSPIVGICGEQRDGKSYFGVWLSYTIMSAFKKTFDLSRNTVYDPMKATRKIGVLSKEALLLDEAAYGYYKREWWDRQHTVFAKIIITQGRKVVCYIFISPFVGDIDKAFVKHFDIVFDVQTRGLVKVFRYKKKYRSRKENDSIEIHMDDIQLSETDLPANVFKEYRAYSNKEKDKIEKSLDDQTHKRSSSLKQIMRGV